MSRISVSSASVSARSVRSSSRKASLASLLVSLLSPPVVMILSLSVVLSSLSLAVGLERKLTAVTVRLPTTHSEGKVKYEIKAYGGEYTWESLDPSVVSIYAESDNAVVVTPSSTSKEGSSKEGKATIIAREKGTNVELKCEVYVSEIDRIKIVTPASRINVFETDQLAIQAYDRGNNLFSGLEGLEFKWFVQDPGVLKLHEPSSSLSNTENTGNTGSTGTLQAGGNNGELFDNNPVQTVSSGSALTGIRLSKPRREIEDRGKHSDIVQVYGKSSGHTDVTASYRSLTSKLRLTIQENLSLTPTFYRTMQGAEIRYGVRILKHGINVDDTTLEQLPASQFYFKSDGKVASIDRETGLAQVQVAETQTDAQTKLQVIDNRVADNVADATLHVQEPTHARIVIRSVDDGEEDLGSLRSSKLHSIKNVKLNSMKQWESLYDAYTTNNLIAGKEYIALLKLMSGGGGSKIPEVLAIPDNFSAEFECSTWENKKTSKDTKGVDAKNFKKLCPLEILSTPVSEYSSGKVSAEYKSMMAGKRHWAVRFKVKDSIKNVEIGFRNMKLKLAKEVADSMSKKDATTSKKKAPVGKGVVDGYLKFNLSVRSEITTSLPLSIGDNKSTVVMPPGHKFEPKLAGGSIEQISGGVEFVVKGRPGCVTVSENASATGGVINSGSEVCDVELIVRCKKNALNQAKLRVHVRDLDRLELVPHKKQVPFVPTKTAQKTEIPIYAKPVPQTEMEKEWLFDVCNNLVKPDLESAAVEPIEGGRVTAITPSTVQGFECGFVTFQPERIGDVRIEMGQGQTVDLSFFNPIEVEFVHNWPFIPPMLSNPGQPQNKTSDATIAKSQFAKSQSKLPNADASVAKSQMKSTGVSFAKADAAIEVGASIELRLSQGPIESKKVKSLKILTGESLLSIKESEESGFKLTCKSPGQVAMEARFDIDDVVSVTKAKLECAEAKQIRIFSLSVPSTPVRDFELGPLSAVCNKKHALIPISYSASGRPLVSRKWKDTITWTAVGGDKSQDAGPTIATVRSIIDGEEGNNEEGNNDSNEEGSDDSDSKTVLAELNLSQAVLDTDSLALLTLNACDPTRGSTEVRIKASYLSQSAVDEVSIYGSSQPELTWPGYPSSNFVFGATKNNKVDKEAFLVTAFGGSKQWKPEYAKDESKFFNLKATKSEGLDVGVIALYNSAEEAARANGVSSVRGARGETVKVTTTSRNENDEIRPDNSLLPAEYSAPDCIVRYGNAVKAGLSNCRHIFSVSSSQPGGHWLRLTDRELLGQEHKEYRFNFLIPAKIELAKSEMQVQVGSDVVVNMWVEGENPKSNGSTESTKSVFHPHVWKAANVECGVKEVSRESNRNLVKGRDYSVELVMRNDANIDLQKLGLVKISKLPEGEYEVSCSSKTQGAAISTKKSMRLTVFPPLQMVPERFVGVPKQTAEFTVVGGLLKHNTVRFSSSESKIVSVDAESGLMEFNTEGKVRITTELISATGDVLAKTSAEVVVAWPGQVSDELVDAKVVYGRSIVVDLFTENSSGSGNSGYFGYSSQNTEKSNHVEKVAFTPALMSFPDYASEIHTGRDTVSGVCGFEWTVNNLSIAKNMGKGISGKGMTSVELVNNAVIDGVRSGGKSNNENSDLSLSVNCGKGNSSNNRQSIDYKRQLDIKYPLSSSYPIVSDRSASVSSGGSVERKSSETLVLTNSITDLSTLLPTNIVHAQLQSLKVEVAHLGKESIVVDKGLSLRIGSDEADAVISIKSEGFRRSLFSVSSTKAEEIRLSSAFFGMQQQQGGGNGESVQGSNGAYNYDAASNFHILPVGAFVDISVDLYSSGIKMLYPTKGATLTAFATHPSRVTATVVGSNTVRIQATEMNRSGCSAIQANVAVTHGVRTNFHRVFNVCLAQETLLPASNSGEKLLLHAGGLTHFFVEEKNEKNRFEMKFSNTEMSANEVERFVREIQRTLEHQSYSVSIASLTSENKLKTLVFDIIPEDNKISNTPSYLANQISKNMNADATPFLYKHWESSAYGIRPVLVKTESGESGANSQRCPDGTWSSSDPTVLSFPNSNVGTAISVTVGQATVRYCGDFEQQTTVEVQKLAIIVAGSVVQDMVLQNFRRQYVYNEADIEKEDQAYAEELQKRVLENQRRKQAEMGGKKANSPQMQQKMSQAYGYQRNVTTLEPSSSFESIRPSSFETNSNSNSVVESIKEYRVPFTMLDVNRRIFDTKNPFILQSIAVQCTGDKILEKFFHISSVGISEGPECVLRTKDTTKERDLQGMISSVFTINDRIPDTLNLKIEARSAKLVGESNYGSSKNRVLAANVPLNFSPNFIVTDVTGKEVNLSKPIRLSASSPSISLRIWHGGRDVKIMDEQVSGARVMVEKITDTIDALTLFLDSPNKAEDSTLMLQGQNSQLENIHIRVNGGKSASVSEQGSNLGWYFGLLMSVLVVYFASTSENFRLLRKGKGTEKSNAGFRNVNPNPNIPNSGTGRGTPNSGIGRSTLNVGSDNIGSNNTHTPFVQPTGRYNVNLVNSGSPFPSNKYTSPFQRQGINSGSAVRHM